MRAASEEVGRLPDLHARSSSSQGTAPSQRSRSGSKAREKESSWDVISSIDQELAKLKPELSQRSQARERLSQELVAAKKAEADAKITLSQSMISEQEKRGLVRARFRAAVRKIMMKNRIISAMNNEMAAQMAAGPLLPQKLRGQLHQLQHSLHGLKYHEEDRERGATRLQAYWRGVLGRRMVCCLRVSKLMHDVHMWVFTSTVKIQCWYRSRSTRKKWRAKIANRIETRRQMEEAFAEQKLRVTIQMQRAIRARLARKRVAEEKERQARKLRAWQQDSAIPDANAGKPVMLVDSWRNPQEDHADKAEVREPPPDLELAKIRDVGLVPFYWNYATDTIRHRIGGPEAIKIQQQLNVGIGASALKTSQSEAGSAASSGDDEAQTGTTFPTEVLPGAEPNGGEQHGVLIEPRKKIRFNSFTAQDDVEAEEAALGANWNVYPEGLPAGFVENLEDVYSKDQKKSKKKQAKKDEQRRPSRRRSSLQVPAPGPPQNAEKRQDHREAELAKKEMAEVKRHVSKAVEHMQHPLLGGLIESIMPNVPEHASPLKTKFSSAISKLGALNSLKPMPPQLPPSGRPRPSLAIARGSLIQPPEPEEDDDDPWSSCTNFYGKERRKVLTTSTDDFTAPMPASGKRLDSGYGSDNFHV